MPIATALVSQSASLTVLDIALLSVLIYSCLRGLFLGLISELGLLLALIVGTILAGRFAVDVGAPLAGFGANITARTVAGYIVVIGSVWLITRVATRVLRGSARLLLLGWADRLAGAAFGLLRGVLVVVVVSFLIVHFRLDPLQTDAQASPLVRGVSFLFPTFAGLLPAYLQ